MDKQLSLSKLKQTHSIVFKKMFSLLFILILSYFFTYIERLIVEVVSIL